MFVYLAHPIDLAGSSSWLGSMIRDLELLLAEAKVGAFRPGKAYLANAGDPTHAEFVQSMNNIAIHQADAFVAVLPADVPTLGTPVEIEFALSMHKPVVVFTDIEASVQLAAWERAGATIARMDDPTFNWPTPEVFRRSLIHRTTAQEEKPCPPIATAEFVGPPPLLISGQAANAQPGKYKGDAGIDLAINNTWSIAPGEFQYLSTGVHVAIPEGFFGWIAGRSSTWRDYRCSVTTGVIDAGYRGELMLGVRNESDQIQRFEAGQRLGQLILLPAWTGQTVAVDQLPEHERGLNGYGSSGR